MCACFSDTVRTYLHASAFAHPHVRTPYPACPHMIYRITSSVVWVCRTTILTLDCARLNEPHHMSQDWVTNLPHLSSSTSSSDLSSSSTPGSVTQIAIVPRLSAKKILGHLRLSTSQGNLFSDSFCSSP